MKQTHTRWSIFATELILLFLTECQNQNHELLDHWLDRKMDRNVNTLFNNDQVASALKCIFFVVRE